jgi:hypothetical protein
VAELQQSMADFFRTKTGKTTQKSVADFGSSGADFKLHSSSKISLTMCFSLDNHSKITKLKHNTPKLIKNIVYGHNTCNKQLHHFKLLSSHPQNH